MNAAAQSKFTSVVCGFTIELGMAIEQIELAGAKPVRPARPVRWGIPVRGSLPVSPVNVAQSTSGLVHMFKYNTATHIASQAWTHLVLVTSKLSS